MRGAAADPSLVTGARGDGITALRVVLGVAVSLVAPKPVHDIRRRRSGRPAGPFIAAGVLDA